MNNSTWYLGVETELLCGVSQQTMAFQSEGYGSGHYNRKVVGWGILTERLWGMCNPTRRLWTHCVLGKLTKRLWTRYLFDYMHVWWCFVGTH